MKLKYRLIIVCSLQFLFATAQNIALKQIFGGKYDFTFIGNTLNPEENSFMTTPSILTQSSAFLNLAPNDVVEKAYLYWAGMGTGDLTITLNGVNITSERNFGLVGFNDKPFFSAFADITAQVQSTGNGIYELSNLDLTADLLDYAASRSNFGGWAIVIVYSNPTLPINQINVYDGLQSIPRNAGQSLNITLNSLKVIDNADAKIGFLAWEGDSNIAVNETLKLNNNILSNPLNPADNAFNGTNNVTNSTDLYNMDLDIYDIQNNINVGDTSARIDLTSGQDFVMINAVVTKLNSQLPDASITIDNVAQTCNSNQVTVTYTVYNTGTDVLLANTLIDFNLNYGIEDQIVFVPYPYIYTPVPIPINSQQTFQVTINLPADTSDDYYFNFCVNKYFYLINTNTPELNSSNNCFKLDVKKLTIPKFKPLPDLESCNKGFTSGYFDFSSYENAVLVVASDQVSFFETENQAINNQNPISDIANYYAISTPKKIYVRLVNTIGCYAITSFNLTTRKCEPTIYNAVSANNDGKNDTFFIDGLRNIFTDFELFVYNRWGQMVWKGNNNIENFNGFSNVGLHLDNKTLPDGTYFYTLNLNDIDFPKPKNGYLYLTR